MGFLCFHILVKGLRPERSEEFTLHTLNYDEAVRKASDLDSIRVAPTQEVALAQMNTIRGFSMETQKITFEEVVQCKKTDREN